MQHCYRTSFQNRNAKGIAHNRLHAGWSPAANRCSCAPSATLNGRIISARLTFQISRSQTATISCEDSLSQKCTETNRNITNIKRYLVSPIPQEKLLDAMNGVLPDLTTVSSDEQNTKQF
ncbi:hypothetical protein AVEN_263572-1 [Araneus ventricosus]|uniref:Uncharacterized protein n=1 Tax=Araneus ventricosus TaxID=182803 RepID=A0A4Y2HTN5_ARAVE|nr:hypothetical protein AVEN_263572-1 [Araneus ventricosus]